MRVWSISASLALLCVALLSVAERGRAEVREPTPEARPRSYRAVRGLVARMEPTHEAELRGRIRARTRLDPTGTHHLSDDGCGFWLSVGTNAWVCGADLAPSSDSPFAEPYPKLRRRRILPWFYVRAPEEGADLFASPEEVSEGEPVEQLRAGFIRRIAFVAGGELYRTYDGHYMLREDVQRLRPSRFSGTPIDDPADLDEIGWIVRHGAIERDAPEGRRVGRIRRLTPIRIEEVLEGPVYALRRGTFVHDRYVRRPIPARRPPEAGADERWIDVDVGRQTLVAYEGDRPVFATLASTGVRWRDRATPLGTFRVWIKVAETTMDDLGNDDESDDYSVEAVPWVQFFEGSIGFHAAYWHRAFGRRVSHGCVNLSPRDARWLYDFTGPTVPAGWEAIRPTETEPGTIVRVRDSSLEPDPSPEGETSEATAEG